MSPDISFHAMRTLHAGMIRTAHKKPVDVQAAHREEQAYTIQVLGGKLFAAAATPRIRARISESSTEAAAAAAANAWQAMPRAERAERQRQRQRQRRLRRWRRRCWGERVSGLDGVVSSAASAGVGQRRAEARRERGCRCRRHRCHATLGQEGGAALNKLWEYVRPHRAAAGPAPALLRGGHDGGVGRLQANGSRRRPDAVESTPSRPSWPASRCSETSPRHECESSTRSSPIASGRAWMDTQSVYSRPSSHSRTSSSRHARRGVIQLRDGCKTRIRLLPGVIDPTHQPSAEHFGPTFFSRGDKSALSSDPKMQKRLRGVHGTASPSVAAFRTCCGATAWPGVCRHAGRGPSTAGRSDADGRARTKRTREEKVGGGGVRARGSRRAAKKERRAAAGAVEAEEEEERKNGNNGRAG